jgi:phosphoribosylpyrophosphate synthetase
MNSIVVFSGHAHPELARALCKRLKVPLSSSTTTTFSNDCLGVQLEANCREADVFLVQPLVPPVQHHLTELLLMLDAARGASAARMELTRAIAAAALGGLGAPSPVEQFRVGRPTHQSGDQGRHRG